MKDLCKFRCRSHNLPVNNGRFIEVTQADLKCTLCKNGDVGDEKKKNLFGYIAYTHFEPWERLQHSSMDRLSPAPFQNGTDCQLLQLMQYLQHRSSRN